MSVFYITEEHVQAAVLGGCVLGGGGGGSAEAGVGLAREALKNGPLMLLSGDDLKEDAILFNVSAVGAPSAKEAYASSEDYQRTIEKLALFTGASPAGITTNEMGGLAAVNGWLQSAKTGIPLVDLPSNGRAHPTGVMGAMGLHRDPNYQSVQAAAGGNPARGKHLEMVVSGTLSNAAQMVRQAAVCAGGMVAVARNPVTVGYAREHAAPGAVRQAIELGTAMLAKQGQGGAAVIDAVCSFLNGTVVQSGMVSRLELTCKNGFDVGTLYLNDLELTFWNEFMTLEQGGKRIATFPDLIAILNTQTGLPVTSATAAEGQDLTVIAVPASQLHLGAGMRSRDLFSACEEAVGKELISYVF